ncbi:MAG: hypothetical protein DRP45_07170 [Candidatus Zixiibacteriota bacterium]|nr:MAG: hypothetical protein DRP45_07170 [candidate division Zixibacteria bacterium]
MTTNLVCDPKILLDKYLSTQDAERYFLLLMAENQKVSLVSRETTREDFDRLVAESLLPLDILRAPMGAYLDIGSGGGMPSIPLLLSQKISGPAILIERTGKKAAALERMITDLPIEASVIARNFEETNLDETFNLVTLRYVKLTPQLLSNIMKVVSPGGVFVYYSQLDFNTPGFSAEVRSFVSPQSEVVKSFTVFRKA